MLDLIIIGLATATVAVTVAQSRLFASLRQRITNRWEWGGELISCPYCLGHWVAVVFVLAAAWTSYFDLLLAWLAVTAIAALVSGAIGRLHVG